MFDQGGEICLLFRNTFGGEVFICGPGSCGGLVLPNVYAPIRLARASAMFATTIHRYSTPLSPSQYEKLYARTPVGCRT